MNCHILAVLLPSLARRLFIMRTVYRRFFIFFSLSLTNMEGKQKGVMMPPRPKTMFPRDNLSCDNGYAIEEN